VALLFYILLQNICPEIWIMNWIIIFARRFGFWIESSYLPWNLDFEFNQWWVTCRKAIQHSNALEIILGRFPLTLIWRIFKVYSSEISVIKRLKQFETKIPKILKDIRDLSWMQRNKPLRPHSYAIFFGLDGLLTHLY